ncbi:MAG TPA: hypothetical protein DDW27_13945 [Bacteroidales bacterium]|nr:hypothetical protein [Bacteroidales bacterium]
MPRERHFFVMRSCGLAVKTLRHKIIVIDNYQELKQTARHFLPGFWWFFDDLFKFKRRSVVVTTIHLLVQIINNFIFVIR